MSAPTDSAADERLRKELRPRALDPAAVAALALRHFPRTLSDMSLDVKGELNSYDDRNYLLGEEHGAKHEFWFKEAGYLEVGPAQ